MSEVERIYELLMAAVSVGTEPSVSAYGRGTTYQHFIPRTKLRRLLVAVDAMGVLAEPTAVVVRESLAAIDRGEGR